MDRFKKFLIYFLIVLGGGIAFIWGLSTYVVKTTSDEIYSNISDLPVSNTIIVLGASVHSNGQLSPILKDRVDTALEIYRAGRGRQFLLSGDNRRNDYDEVSAMKNYLLEREVPENLIFTDPAGLDTYDSMYRSDLIYKIPNAIVVTQKFHLPRALFIAESLGLNYIGFPAKENHYDTDKSLIRREKLANLKAVLEILTKQTPKNMGEENPVNRY
ncbi:SanA protein [Gillisia sp. Hel_I_86]|uniref:SanA/YdcF family protein n=1 Tax=Gillisia sp. Hel_I_86 TaxID=1249981 RepID=UPI00119B9414|nr:ElyC/SanA/YdcF family protein [Gillisia sp. Hel_I_86]TVZ28055.1 SanA protein [Gillisia sp. Hel_I_86]